MKSMWYNLDPLRPLAERLPWLPSLMLVAEASFLLERRHADKPTETDTHKITDATGHFTHGLATAGLGEVAQILSWR